LQAAEYGTISQDGRKSALLPFQMGRPLYRPRLCGANADDSKRFIVKTAETLRSGFWNRSHHLDRMTFRELVVAYIQYPAIIAYVLLSLGAIGLYAWKPAPLLPKLGAIAVAVFV
jgi:hypothetical protein